MTEIKLRLNASGEMLAIIPSAIENRAQLVSIPLTLAGLRILKRILVARDKGTAKLGAEAEPTQALIHEWLRAERQRQLDKTIAEVQDLELEIDL